MNIKAVAAEADFCFSATNLEKARAIIAKYPEGKQRSAVLPLLDLAQRQNNNYLSKPAMDYVADFLGLAPIKIYEVASFYTMYNLQPVGKNFVQVCTTTPCWLRGSDDVVRACEKKLGVKLGETTTDGEFTLVEVECLGACVNAPMMQINDDYYEDLTAQSAENILEKLARGEKPVTGSQIGRKGACPEGGATTLVADISNKVEG
ncbi:MAG: NADH-quinone oxidoreductase subunit NuoE [Alphaproteobacteria bacterium]